MGCVSLFFRRLRDLSVAFWLRHSATGNICRRHVELKVYRSSFLKVTMEEYV